MAKKRSKGTDWLPLAGFFVLVAVFLLVESYGLNYNRGDENTLFYFGKLIADGKVPYRDFFFSHPPLGVYINAAIFMLLGFNFTALKLVAPLACAASGYLIFRIISRLQGQYAGLLASALFFSSIDVLVISSHQNGVEVTVALMLLSLCLFIDKKPLMSGLSLGLASAAGLYAAVLFAAYVVFFALRKRPVTEDSKALVGGFLAVFFGYNIVFYLVAGHGFLLGTYLYHLQKPAIAGFDAATIFPGVLGKNVLVFAPLLLWVFAYAKLKRDDPLVLILIAAAGYVLFLFASKIIFDYYFMLLFPFVAMASAAAIYRVYSGWREWGMPFAAAVGLALLVYSFFSLSTVLTLEASHLENVGNMGEVIRNNSKPTDTIFGESTVAPLAALVSGRALAFDEVDTNTMRYLSNSSDLGQTLSRLHGSSDFKFFVISMREGVGVMPQTKDFLQRNCKPLAGFDEGPRGLYAVYDCRPGK